MPKKRFNLDILCLTFDLHQLFDTFGNFRPFMMHKFWLIYSFFTVFFSNLSFFKLNKRIGVEWYIISRIFALIQLFDLFWSYYTKIYEIFMKFLNPNSIFYWVCQEKMVILGHSIHLRQFFVIWPPNFDHAVGVQPVIEWIRFLVPSLVLSYIFIFCKPKYDRTTWFDIKMTFW